LTDLTFIEEGNPDCLNSSGKSFAEPSKNANEDEQPLIHFRKRELQFRVISEIQQFQKWRYTNIESKGDSPILEELPRNEEDQLYGLSLLREPRDASRDQIV